MIQSTPHGLFLMVWTKTLRRANCAISNRQRMPEDGVTLLPLGESRRVNSLPEFLDVLMVGRPTDSVRWNELTAPSDHWHPAFGDRPSST
jgi:hypothetical protein